VQTNQQLTIETGPEIALCNISNIQNFITHIIILGSQGISPVANFDVFLEALRKAIILSGWHGINSKAREKGKDESIVYKLNRNSERSTLERRLQSKPFSRKAVLNLSQLRLLPSQRNAISITISSLIPDAVSTELWQNSATWRAHCATLRRQ
jgi:hypothetical protein